MSKNQQRIHRLIWLVNTILSAGEQGLRLSDIRNRWEMHTSDASADYPSRTFINHKNDIAEIFGLDIGCRIVGKGSGRECYYFIENPEDLTSSRAQGWLISTFSLKSILSEGESIRDSISLEDIPRGQQWLPLLISAIRCRNRLRLDYDKYHSDPEIVEVCPYGLKVFKQRWYLIARISPSGAFRTYSLDRIAGIASTGEGFVRDDSWNIDEHFASSVGIWTADSLATRVLLKVTPFLAKYLEGLPLHSSQQYEGQTPQGDMLYSYWLKITPDLEQELFRFMDQAEVLEPSSLRLKMAAVASNINKLYNTNDNE